MTADEEITCPRCGSQLTRSDLANLYVCASCDKAFFVRAMPLDDQRLRVTRSGHLLEFSEVTISTLLRKQVLRQRAGPADEEFRQVAILDEVPEGSFKWVRLGDEGIIVVRHAGSIYAMADTCTHAMGPLALGKMECGELVCPEHGARFDVRTGSPINWPNIPSLETYEVKVVGEKILVRSRRRDRIGK